MFKMNKENKKSVVTIAEAVDFLKKQEKFYLATVEKDKPKIRPFGAVTEFEGRLYITTSNSKDVFKQIQENPNVSICACDEKRKWLRIEGKAKFDERIEAKQNMLDSNPVLIRNKRYTSASDETMALFYIDGAEISFN